MGATPALPHVIGNKVSTTLSSGINNSTTTIPLTSGAGLNTTGGYIIVDKGTSTEEIIYLESVSGSTGTASSDGRGAQGTSAFSHTTGATVYDVLVKDHVEGQRAAFLTEHNLDGTHTTNVDKVVDNTKAFKGKESGGTARNIGTVTSGNYLEVGDTNLNGTTTYLKMLVDAAATGSQAVTSGAAATVVLDTELFDPASLFASNTFTAPVTGKYLFVGQVDITNPGDQNSLQVTLVVNGASTPARSTQAASGTGEQVVTITRLISLTATDTVVMKILHNKGSNIALGNNPDTFLSIFFVSK